MQGYNAELAKKFKDAAQNGDIDVMATLIATQLSLGGENLPNYLGQALVEAVTYEKREERRDGEIHFKLRNTR